MTLRQLWVRVISLPARSPLFAALEAEKKKADDDQAAADVDEVLERFGRGG